MEAVKTACGKGSCEGCSGCSVMGGSVALTEEELSLLTKFRELPFLPIARKSGEEKPTFIENGEDIGVTALWLKVKGLVSLDYDMPLQNYDYAEYRGCAALGSMALTALGQSALDSLDVLGTEE